MKWTFFQLPCHVSKRMKLLVLMKTRVNSSRSPKIIERINFPNIVEIPPEGFSRGLWLLCKTNIDFKIDIMHERYIHCQIRDNKGYSHWLVTFLNRYLQHYLQNNLWKKKSVTNRSSVEPWMIIGV